MEAAGPVVDPLPCSGCGKLIDPLRAGHVAIFDLKFHFFCDPVLCRGAFLGLTDEERDEEAAVVVAVRSAGAREEAARRGHGKGDDRLDRQGRRVRRPR